LPLSVRPNPSEHARSCVSQLFGPGFNVTLVARTNPQLSAVFCQRFGDGLANLSIRRSRPLRWPLYDGHSAYKSGLHVVQSETYLL